MRIKQYSIRDLLIATVLSGVALIVFYPKIFTGTYATITIKSLSLSRSGDVTIRWHQKSSNGTFTKTYFSKNFEFSNYYSGQKKLFPGWPSSTAGLLVFNVDPEEEHLSLLEYQSRIGVQAGDVVVLRPHESLEFCNFSAKSGVRYVGGLKIVTDDNLPDMKKEFFIALDRIENQRTKARLLETIDGDNTRRRNQDAID